MPVYLVRHAHALAGEDDAARPLSKKGRQQIRAMGGFLRGGERIVAREFWHSPLVRARETARLLVRRLRVRAKLVEVSGLLHEDKPAIMAKRLAARRRPVAVVGHEPHLSALASLLLAGRPSPPVVVLKKAAMLALEKKKGRWSVRWLVAPEVL